MSGALGAARALHPSGRLPPRAGVTGKAKPGFKTAAKPAKPVGQGSRKPR